MTLNCLSRRQDSNLRPAHYKYAALPSELRRHVEPPGRLSPDLHTAPTKAGMADDVLFRPRLRGHGWT